MCITGYSSMDNSVHSTWKSKDKCCPHPANKVTHNSIKQPVIRHFHNAGYAGIPPIHSIFLSKKFNKKSPALYRKLLSAKKAHGLQFTVPCAFTLLFRYLIVLLLLCQLHNLKLKLLSEYNKKVPAAHQLPLPPQSLRGYCFPATFIA